MSNVTLGKYRLLAELGHGGMADVYLAVVEGPVGSGFAKLAVIKRLRPHLVEDAEFVAMLIDEARITARLNHANVVQMLEVGYEGDEYFLAMEYLEGQPLHRVWRRASKSGPTLSRTVQLTILTDVLAGLHHAHELTDYDGTSLGVVHRDVTPQNIFVTYDGTVKVVDFGIAKAAGRASETKHGIVKGKVRYMSPEQAVGTAVDRRSDIFSVGIMLWTALTDGEKFWGDRDDLEIVQSLVAGNYDPSPRSVCPDLPEELDAICKKALARNPEDRFQTAEDMRIALESFLDVGAVSARREISCVMSALFTEDRNKVRTVLESIGKLEVSSSTFLEAANASSSSSSSSMILRNVPAMPPPPNSMSLRAGGTALLQRPSPLRPVMSVAPSALSSLAPTARDQSGSSYPSQSVGASTPKRNVATFAFIAAVAAVLAAFGLSRVDGVVSTASAATHERATVAANRSPLVAPTLGKDTGPTFIYVYQSVPTAPAHNAHAASSAHVDAAAAPPASAVATVSAPAKPTHPRGRLSIDQADPWGRGAN
ncbi:MAG TPA: serine/threonine-protein kinase [Labilithrix sp.]